MELRLLTKSRLSASIGAGGVLYLTPIIFSLSLSASEIGNGIVIAAIAGIITRIITGFYLDKGTSFKTLLKVAALLAIIADFIFISAIHFGQFAIAELLMGAAAGIYWPSIEIAVPIVCREYQSSKGFAIVRTADALGVFIGTLLGAIAIYLGLTRSIYIIDTIFLVVFVKLISSKHIKGSAVNLIGRQTSDKTFNIIERFRNKNVHNLLPKLLPILIIGFFATGMLSLQHSALPLDLVAGGIRRPALTKSSASFLMAYQLVLLPIIQWPIGNWLARKKLYYGIALSIFSFIIGNLLICISSLYINGIIFTLLGMLAISIGLACFLPTATEVIIQISPEKQRGTSLAIYSQCFGISSIIQPWIAVKVMNYNLFEQNQGSFYFWLINSFMFLAILPLARSIGRKSLN